jgi:hypothetical protein
VDLRQQGGPPRRDDRRVDRGDRTVHVYRSKDEIKNAPKFDRDTYRDPAYRDQLGEYYSRFRY